MAVVTREFVGRENTREGADDIPTVLRRSSTGLLSQLNLFDEVQPRKRSEQLMKVLDGINHSGLGKVWFAGRGIAPEWQMKREMLSPAYTTKWTDIPCASI